MSLFHNKALNLLLLKAQKDIFSTQIGENSTKIKGVGFDFTELREYTVGDDIRHIDWIITAKTNKPHVKIFENKKELSVTLALFLSASLQFGLSRLKRELLVEVAVLLGFATLKQGDSFESYICHKEIELITRRSKQPIFIHHLAENLTQAKLHKQSIEYSKVSQKLYKSIVGKSLLFFIGDFLESVELELTALAQKHELIFIILRDRFEEAPSAVGKINIIDPQTGEFGRYNLSTNAVKEIKIQRERADKILFEQLKKNHIKYVKIYTDETALEKLLPFMSLL